MELIRFDGVIFFSSIIMFVAPLCSAAVETIHRIVEKPRRITVPLLRMWIEVACLGPVLTIYLWLLTSNFSIYCVAKWGMWRRVV